MSSVSRDQRHSRARRCPICDGADQDPRGKSRRCVGFTNEEAGYTHCSREEFAGSLPGKDVQGVTLFSHRLHGSCRCGVEHGAPRTETRDMIEATYPYYDEHGVLLFEVVRKVGKKFLQRKPDGAGGWTWKLGTPEETRRVLYRLPQLLAADPARTVYIVEGEKDVAALERIGQLATCNPGGAGKWPAVAELARTVLAERRVVVVADKDAVGRKHAAQILASLPGATLLEAPDPHKDIADLLGAGGTLGDLVAIAPVPAKPPSKPAIKQSWKSRLLRKKGEDSPFRPIVANVITILTNDPAWEGVIAYDEFGETIVTRKPPPWRPGDAPTAVMTGDWTDLDTVRTQAWLSDRYGLDVGQDITLAGVSVAADRYRFHPVRDWLDGLRWDGKKRLPTWLSDVFGCPDTPYSRAVGQAWAISAIARAYTPGCKVDTVLVLEGDPGIRKSSVLRTLFGDEWFLEMSITDVANKDAMQLLKRKWGAEFPEIDGLSKTEQAHVKAYFSRQVDTYRPSYGKGTRDFPRQIVFAATTNKSEYLSDETGGTGRRMWPVRARQGDIALAATIREQLWAEAVARFQSGEAWHIQDPSLRDAEREEQDARFRTDPWEQSVAEWLAKPVDLGGTRAKAGVTTSDVLVALGIETGRRSHADAVRVGAIMRRLGWYPGTNPETRNGARVRVYRPKHDLAINDSNDLNVEVLDPPGTPIPDIDPAELALMLAE